MNNTSSLIIDRDSRSWRRKIRMQRGRGLVGRVGVQTTEDKLAIANNRDAITKKSMSDDGEASDYIHRVKLTLIDISEEVREDADGCRIVSLVEKKVLIAPTLASKFLSGENASREEIETIQKQILRFLRVQDKYTALGSMLLKSQAFHVVHKSPNFEDRPIVELPRTDYRKPYIPLAENDSLRSSTKAEDYYPLSISHQFPFAGSAMLDRSMDDSPEYRPKIGFDIVAFDGYNSRLYSNEQEFLDVFKDSFTQREWSLINAEKIFRLEEFYCRWAMKEAYTKALGVGLGFEFNSFDLALSPLDRDGRDRDLWQTLSSKPNGSYIDGSVQFLRDNKSPENWGFYFLPLRGKDDNGDFTGCACISVGPFPTTHGGFQVTIEWTNLDNLIIWHLVHAQ